jgi:hypothetical protein
MDRRKMLGLCGTTGIGLGLGGNLLNAAQHGHGANTNASKENPPTGPLDSPHAFFCGIHMAKKDPKFQLITQHYCAAHSHSDNPDDQMFQCVLFDSSDKNAKLLGVEYLISDKKYRSLPEHEKQYWHAHTYEVLGGGLIAPLMKPAEEMAFMKNILTTWGKAWHTWPDPKTDVPMGEPLLIWSLMGEGQVDPKLLAARDKQFNVDAAKLSEMRMNELGFELPRVSPPKSLNQVGRQWNDQAEDRPTLRKKRI